MGTATSLVWNGITNGVQVGSWDVSVTPDWRGGLKYTQPSIPGSFVQFDDTAAGTTTVSINSNLAPVLMIVTNTTKTYTFTGSGALGGPGKLIKDGTALMTLSNSGANTNAGEIDINNGTLQIAGSNNRLPVNGAVVLANTATATLDLNGLNQTLASVSGGGSTFGNITEGAGNLTITGNGNYGGVISGSGQLLKTTSGTLTLTSPNIYSGGTVISSGSTVLIANSSGSGLGSGDVLINSGGALQFGDGATANGSIAAPIITNNGSVNFLLAGSDVYLTNIIYGSGSLNKLIGSGSGAIFITNDNYYTGGTSLGLGIIQISSPHALGSGQINGGNQTVQDTYLALSGGITLTNFINLPAKSGGFSGSGPVDHIDNIDSTNTLTGNIQLGGSTVFAIGSDSGTLIIAGNLINAQVANPGRFFLRGSGNGIYQGAFNEGVGNPHPLELDKIDTGTWFRYLYVDLCHRDGRARSQNKSASGFCSVYLLRACYRKAWETVSPARGWNFISVSPRSRQTQFKLVGHFGTGNRPHQIPFWRTDSDFC